MSRNFERILIVGCGYVGRRVARRWSDRGIRVRALARSDEAVTRLRALGIDPMAGDLDHPESLVDLDTARALVYYFAPPPAQGERDPRMRAFVDAVMGRAPPARVVLMSTTGVYGDCGGAWVREDAPVHPRTARARRRLDAETVLRRAGLAAAVPVVVLRVAGIYGPGRLPLARLRERLPLPPASQCPYTNRIHADDLAKVCVAAAERGQAGSVYNVSDGAPSTMVEYFCRVADYAGLPHPPTVPLAEARRALSGAMMEYLTESRRIDNGKMLRELAVRLDYPDLETGLSACAGEH